MQRITLIILLSLCQPIFCNGQPQDSHKKSLLNHFKFTNGDTSRLGKKEFFMIPVLYRSPETGFAFGALGLALFKMPGVKDTSTRTSNMEIPVVYTQRNQFVVDVLYNLISNKERFFLRGLNAYNQFSEFFYGIGNNPDAFKTNVSYNNIRTLQRLTYRFDKRNFFGIQYQFYDLYKVKFNNNEHFHRQDSIIGKKGFHTSGAGFIYLFDSRDNVINSHTGTYLDVSNFFYLKQLGSQYNFQNLVIDFRKFYAITKTNTLAFQCIINTNFSGEVPFKQNANLGGFSMMRGYYMGRYRDNNLVAFQSEYRFKVWSFLGMVLFGSVGEVAHRPNSFTLNNLKFGGGTGFRFMIEKHERVNIRLDFGFGQQVPGIYLNIGEAF